MKKIILISILLLSNNIFAINETNFVGKFVADKSGGYGDCSEGTIYYVKYDEKKDALEIQVKKDDGNFSKMTIHTKPDIHYRLYKETNNLEIKRYGIFWDYKEAQRASKDSQTYYENSKYVLFDSKGNGEQIGYSYQELSLSKDKKKLTYYLEEGDGENDPHEYMCKLERASK